MGSSRSAGSAGALRTTDSSHSHLVAPDLLHRGFDVNGIRETDRLWVSDITYMPTGEGWLYLAVVLDLKSRRVVGWAMRPTLKAELAVSARRIALVTRQPAAGVVHHSDRGVQYACGEYRTLLAARGIEASMSGKGDCWDNAVAESFFATLERVLIARHRWATRAEATQAIFRYIESWYNLGVGINPVSTKPGQVPSLQGRRRERTRSTRATDSESLEQPCGSFRHACSSRRVLSVVYGPARLAAVR